MKKFLKKLAFQLDKPFYVWALLAGPPWAQNITLFAIWIYIVLLLLVFATQMMNKSEMPENVRNNRKEVEELAAIKPNFLWALPSLAVGVAAASQAWFFCATIYFILILVTFGGSINLRDRAKEALDAAKGEGT